MIETAVQDFPLKPWPDRVGTTGQFTSTVDKVLPDGRIAAWGLPPWMTLQSAVSFSSFHFTARAAKACVTIFLMIAGLKVLSLSASAQPAAAVGVVPAKQSGSASFTVSATVTVTNENDFSMNFVNTPLDQVLAYLSDVAGFIFVPQTPVDGTVSITGKHLTKDQALDLLNTELSRGNYAAVRNGRMVTITTRRDAMTSLMPVLTGNDPAMIPNDAKIATWIVPVRFVEAQKLVSELSPYVSSQARVTANDDGNSIIITDTQSNIRHLVQIVRAVDNSAQAQNEIRIFPLQHANPEDVVNELNNVFPGSSSSDDQAPIQFAGGFGGGPGGGFPGLPGGSGTTASGAGGSQQRIQKATQVTAVADDRLPAVIVTAPKNLMGEIEKMMTDLDVKSDRDQRVYVFKLQNGDPQQVVQVLQGMFSSGDTTSSGSSQSSALQTRAQNNTSQMSSGTTTGVSTFNSGTGGGSRGGGGGAGGRGGG